MSAGISDVFRGCGQQFDIAKVFFKFSKSAKMGDVIGMNADCRNVEGAIFFVARNLLAQGEVGFIGFVERIGIGIQFCFKLQNGSQLLVI